MADLPCTSQASLKKRHGSRSVTALFMVASTSLSCGHGAVTQPYRQQFLCLHSEDIHPQEHLKESMESVHRLCTHNMLTILHHKWSCFLIDMERHLIFPGVPSLKC